MPSLPAVAQVNGWIKAVGGGYESAMATYWLAYHQSTVTRLIQAASDDQQMLTAVSFLDLAEKEFLSTAADTP